MSTSQQSKDSTVVDTAKSPEQSRRDFLNSFGKLALVTPVAMTVLMSPKTSAAPRSCKGWKKNQCK